VVTIVGMPWAWWIMSVAGGGGMLAAAVVAVAEVQGVRAACRGDARAAAVAGDGRRCGDGGGVGTVGHIEIADKTTIGGGTSVTHSITESGQHVAGIFPMSSYKEWARNAVHIHRLNETGKRIKQLEQELAELKNDK